jgi:hypothetical protein
LRVFHPASKSCGWITAKIALKSVFESEMEWSQPKAAGELKIWLTCGSSCARYSIEIKVEMYYEQFDNSTGRRTYLMTLLKPCGRHTDRAFWYISS